jgi:hypothetical protein
MFVLRPPRRPSRRGRTHEGASRARWSLHSPRESGRPARRDRGPQRACSAVGREATQRRSRPRPALGGGGTRRRERKRSRRRRTSLRVPASGQRRHLDAEGVELATGKVQEPRVPRPQRVEPRAEPRDGLRVGGPAGDGRRGDREARRHATPPASRSKRSSSAGSTRTHLGERRRTRRRPALTHAWTVRRFTPRRVPTCARVRSGAATGAAAGDDGELPTARLQTGRGVGEAGAADATWARVVVARAEAPVSGRPEPRELVRG